MFEKSMFGKLMGSWEQPAKPFAGHSRLISRACLARATADGLLLDRPQRGRGRAVLRVTSLLLFSVLVVSKPVKTGAGDGEALAAVKREASAQPESTFPRAARGSAQSLHL